MNNQAVLHICTYFDFNFLPRGLALYHSIKRFHDNFVFYALVFDTETYNYLNVLNFSNIVLISPESYNKHFNTDPVKFSDRKQYFFSSTPNLCLYIFEKYKDVDILLYLDADVCVYNSLDILYKEAGEASIAFCSHRFYPLFNLLSKNYGRYNVGVNYFKRTEMGLKCLTDWKMDCDSWYTGKPGYPLNFFSDQIFLNKWCDRYTGIKIIENIGINAAPWNVANYRFYISEGTYMVNNTPLIIYHFSSLKKISENKWNGNTIYFFGSIRGGLLKIYQRYITEIESFGLMNMKITTITHTNSFLKKIFYFVMKVFLNETIINRQQSKYDNR
jgi:hypothetical protein